ncbi:tripartite tricarboxylate transporter TctB family protein [Pseudomonas benzenivorans]|uniref:Tripartite tricarboxylate transporter TctB family protein n=1 Tax=Pseudomonas benzenivorans TaxID=556533 RepID=A0ABY5H3Z1_9PSED|nr:tripartite tricarboxylate transporter TctB family protein [Pseudomonas benzenivorans]UTW06363.1 tripartite tricarboxylate transporter TctB family protein [Pseudomonas benzenivorans]
MHDRLFAGCNLLICAVLALLAWGYHAPFAYEPVGPRAYPLLLLVLLGLGALYQLLKPAQPSQESAEPPLDRHVIGKIALCIAAMLVYAALFEVLGFILGSVLFAAAMAYLYGATWLQSGLGGVLIAVGLYLLFDYGLDVPLPLGMLAKLGS